MQTENTKYCTYLVILNGQYLVIVIIILQITLTHELGYLITDSSTSWGTVPHIREMYCEA